MTPRPPAVIGTLKIPVVAGAEASAEAARQRPEVVQSNADIRSAEASVRIAEIRAGLQISLSANSSVQVSPNPGQAGWGISANVSHPLFDGGRSRAELDEARATLSSAQARRESTLLQVQTQAYQAAVSVASASARSEATRVAAEAAAESLRVEEGRYQAGVGTLVEVLAAQSSAAEARVAAVQALYDLQLAVVNLQHATGRTLVAGGGVQGARP